MAVPAPSAERTWTLEPELASPAPRRLRPSAGGWFLLGAASLAPLAIAVLPHCTRPLRGEPPAWCVSAAALVLAAIGWWLCGPNLRQLARALRHGRPCRARLVAASTRSGKPDDLRKRTAKAAGSLHVSRLRVRCSVEVAPGRWQLLEAGLLLHDEGVERPFERDLTVLVDPAEPTQLVVYENAKALLRVAGDRATRGA